MTDTTASTRQRLLDLWEKCPECKPRHVVILNEGAFDLACIAMVRWLAGKCTDLLIIDGWTVTTSTDLPYERTSEDEDFTDVLISAVEAVMENQQKESDNDSK